MYSIETHTAKAFRNALIAANAADKAGGTLDRRMTEAFVALIVADPAATAITASKRIGDAIPQSKESGNPAATRKSWNVSYFKDTANVAAARAAIPNPESLSPDDFQKAVEAHSATLNVRAAYKARAKAKAETAKADEKAVADNVREPGDDETAPVVLNPDFDPVLAALTDARKAIANLREMTGNADPETATAATEALATIAAMFAPAEEARKAA